LKYSFNAETIRLGTNENRNALLIGSTAVVPMILVAGEKSHNSSNPLGFHSLREHEK
jgi:presenilin-like A22 family membrane protease